MRLLATIATVASLGATLALGLLAALALWRAHRRREVDRATVAAPFYLRLRDGTRVLVEPPRTVDVADALDGKVRVSETERIRTAELVPGEVLYARGRLARGGPAAPAETTGYRDVTWGWVLQPAQGQMRLSSTPLGDGLRQRARFHRTTGWRALALHVSLIGYHLRAPGHVSYVPVETTRADPAHDSDGNRYTRDTATVTLPGASRTRFRRRRIRPWFRGTVVDSRPGRLSETRTS